MDFLDLIKKETIIITNKYLKKNILNMHKLIPIKLMSIKEFKEKYYFSYDETAIIYTMKKLNIKYEIAKEYIDNLYYIEDTTYENEKLSFLSNLKKELDDQKLLTYNNLFKEYIKRTPIIIYNENIESLPKNTFENLNYHIIKRKYKNYTHQIYEFVTMEEEVRYIATDISSKINSGISIDKIKLMNIDESYYNTINRVFSLFNLKAKISYKRPLSSYPLVKKFLNNYCDANLSISESLKNLDENSNIYNELITVLNKYHNYQDKNLIIYKIEHTYINSTSYNNEIEIVDYLDYISNNDEYIYMLGFNEEIIPKNYYDTEYLNDDIKKYLGLKDSKELNVQIRTDTIKAIKDIKNLVITYKLRDSQKKYYPSSLCNEFEVIKKQVDYKTSYSEKYDKIILAKEYDNYVKYGYKSDAFDILNANNEIAYNSYSNKYTKINRNMNKLNLSYSKMQIYNKCAFRYYLTDVLKLDIYEENFSITIGNMVHYVMEKILSNNDLDIDKYVIEFLNNKTFSKKENFFLEKYKQCIEKLLNQVLLEKNYRLLNNEMYEKRIDVDYGNNIHFTGIIDKIIYKVDNGNTYVTLIDYKTGNDDISLKYLKYGINIQLPIYLYLSTKLNFKNIKYCGFYLQKLNITANDYRLVGYSNSDKEILQMMDNECENSKIIKGLKTLKDGSFSKNSKVLNDKEITNIKNVVSNIIKNTISKIDNNEFEINPKIDNGKNISCEYCKFNDICFKQKEDEIIIIPDEFGGEE